MKIDGGKYPSWYTYRQIEQISQMTRAEQAATQEAQSHNAQEHQANSSNRAVRMERIHVRKGEKDTKVLLWKTTIGTDEHGNREITSVLQRTFTVFHASQIESIPEYVLPEINIIAAHEKAEKIIADSGVRIFLWGGEAYYKPIEDFKSQEGYYSILRFSMSSYTLQAIRVGLIENSVVGIAADFHRNMRLKNW